VDFEYDQDGTPWVQSAGTGMPRDCRVDRLEQKLAEVKVLYQQKYGEPVDEDFCLEYDEEGIAWDKDGASWVETAGTVVSRDMRVEKLEQMLADVKGLYKEKYGQEVDFEYDQDGTPWVETVGSGIPRDCRMERLEQKLAEVKVMYQQKYGHSVDDEEGDYEYDDDGTLWIRWGPTGKASRERPSQEKLESLLTDVKALYMQKYGQHVDFEYDQDGTPWVQTLGTGAPKDCRIEKLDYLLAECKVLYKTRYGHDVDEDGSEEEKSDPGTPWNVANDFEHDEDGTMWIRSGPTRPEQHFDQVAPVHSGRSRLLAFLRKVECCSLQ